MNLTACPHCGAKLLPVADAFCSECRGELSQPVASDITDKFDLPKSVTKRAPGTPFGCIFGGLGLLMGFANSALSLTRDGGGNQVAHEGMAYLVGYLCGPAAILGLIGLVFGVVLGRFVRPVGRPHPRLLVAAAHQASDTSISGTAAYSGA